MSVPSIFSTYIEHVSPWSLLKYKYSTWSCCLYNTYAILECLLCSRILFNRFARVIYVPQSKNMGHGIALSFGDKDRVHEQPIILLEKIISNCDSISGWLIAKIVKWESKFVLHCRCRKLPTGSSTKQLIQGLYKVFNRVCDIVEIAHIWRRRGHGWNERLQMLAISLPTCQQDQSIMQVSQSLSITDCKLGIYCTCQGSFEAMHLRINMICAKDLHVQAASS